MRITVGHLIAFVAVLGIGVTAAFLLRPSTGGTKRELTKTQVGSISTTPAVGVNELTVQPVRPGNPDCEGIFRAGQEVRYAGGGFTPGTSVRIFISSPGLDSSGELEVAEVASDENGDIAGAVRIPLGATGFAKDGASSGLVFFHALGLGSAANHLDDIAMIGLAPDTSSCGSG